MRTLLALFALAACTEQPERKATSTPGARLEAAAVAQGLVVDPARATLAGLWARDTDRLCITGSEGGEQRVGILIDYGEGQGCSAAGEVRRTGDRLAMSLGECRLEARFDGERIVMPAKVPSACDALCTGRATLAAMEVEQLSSATSEVSTLRRRGGTPLCPN